MATRLLLTLLALLTGLATQLSPAQARGGAAVETEIGVVSGPRVAEQRGVTGAALLPAKRGKSRLSVVPFIAPEESPAIVRTVLQGIDRSRE